MALKIKYCILICFLAVVLFITCHQKQKTNIGYGGKLYSSRCLACHGPKSSVDDDKSTLLKMSEYDSSSLFKKLLRLKDDNYHKGYLNDIEYSEAEAESIMLFIKSYNGAVPNKRHDQ
jgi:hypothetical protein